MGWAAAARAPPAVTATLYGRSGTAVDAGAIGRGGDGGAGDRGEGAAGRGAADLVVARHLGQGVAAPPQLLRAPVMRVAAAAAAAAGKVRARPRRRRCNREPASKDPARRGAIRCCFYSGTVPLFLYPSLSK